MKIIATMWKPVLKRMAWDVWNQVLAPLLTLIGAMAGAALMIVSAAALSSTIHPPLPAVVAGALLWACLFGLGLCIWVDNILTELRRKGK